MATPRTGKPLHRHHIVPRHSGGTNEAANLTPPISLRLHAMFHFDRWKCVGDARDLAAYKTLLGLITVEEARRLVVSQRLTGRVFSPETLAKMSAAQKARDRSTFARIPAERRAANSLARRGKREFIEQAIAAVPAANRSRVWSPESRKKLADSQRRRWSQLDPGDRAALLQGLRAQKSDATRARMGAALKGRPKSDRHRAALSVAATKRAPNMQRDEVGRWR